MMKTFKKTISLLLVLSLFAGILCSCGGSETEIPKGMQLVESEFTNYKLFIPNSWTPDISTGVVTAKASDNSNISVQMMTFGGSYKSIDDYFRTDYYQKVTSTFKSTTLIENECLIEGQTFGTIKLDCARYVYTVESDNTTYKFMQYFMYYSGYLYIFTYTATEARFAEHLEEVSDMVNHFVF